VYLFDLAPKREEKKLPLTFSGLIRGALGISSDCETYQNGDPSWFEKLGEEKSPGPKSKSMEEPSRPPSRNLTVVQSVLTHKTPSALAHKDSPFAAHRLRTGHREGLFRGSLIHIFCETISWLNQEIPSDEQLFLAASRKLPKASIEQDVIRQFRSYLEQKTVRQVFSLCRYPGFESREILLYREFPFAVRENDDLLSGSIDRLVVCTKGGKACSAEIFDFKTDRIADESFDEKIKLYRPQLEAYRSIVSRVFSLESKSCSAKLVFLSGGRVVEV
jgi:ATP-dependent exoDNAse (exonuclease V) beta subunit